MVPGAAGHPQDEEGGEVIFRTWLYFNNVADPAQVKVVTGPEVHVPDDAEDVFSLIDREVNPERFDPTTPGEAWNFLNFTWKLV